MSTRSPSSEFKSEARFYFGLSHDEIYPRICVPDSGATLSAPLHIAANHTVVSPAWEENDCYGTEAVDSCKVAGGKCETITEGFYYMSVAWALIGLLWLVWGVRTFRQFQEIQVRFRREEG